MSEARRGTFPGKLRWFTPSRDDTSVFLWLFLITTGWNLSTALLANNKTITREQEERLRDLRMRTQVGMGCWDPLNPPRHVAPKHLPGTLCAVQRCTLCEHGVVFEETQPETARPRGDPESVFPYCELYKL